MKKTYFYIITIIFLLLLERPIIAQNGDAFTTNLNTPTYGMIVNDIAYTNTNNVYVYSLKKLLVFNGSNTTNKSIINFGGSNEEYGQYQFPFNQIEELAVQNMMAIDNNNGYIYVVTPKLKLIRININTNQKDPNFFIQSPTGTLLAGDNIIKYDNTHNRLFWAYRIKGQNGFHFGVYQADGTNLNLINSFNDYYSPNDPSYQIFDIAFNETNNIFYLSRNGSYEVWDISGNNLVLKKTVSIGIYDRTGQLIYVHNTNLHKIFCLPFGTDYAPATLYVIDGDNYNQVTQFAMPYRKVRTGIYDASHNNLILGFLMDGEGNPSYDIAVYHYDNNNFSLIQTLSTGNTATGNSPLYIEKKQNKFIIAKRDEIILLNWMENSNPPYSSQTLKTAKSNYFIKSVTTNDFHNYVVKSVGGGVETINPDNTIGQNIETGSICYNGVFNNISQKAYFFSKQHYQNSKIFIVNTNTNSVSELSFNYPIGDVVFNPYNNQFIVIENKNENTSFKVYDGITDNLITEYATNMTNCEKMFISPDNRLYVTGNMLPNNGNIQIKVYNATTYALISTLDFNYTSTLTSGYVKADFDYNVRNDCVYAVFHTFYAGFSPMAQTPETSDGVLIKIDKNLTLTTYTNGMNLPAEIICDNSESALTNEADQQYQGSCFIRMEGGNVFVFDCYNETLTSAGSYNDITYDPFSDVVYGINGGSNGIIRTIDKNGTQTLIYSSANLSECRSINYNRHNNLLYLYVVKSDNSPQTMLYSIDPVNITTGIQSTYLHNKSIDILGDNDFYFSNKLIFDPFSNKIFITNGTHGNISVVSFTTEEPHYLHAGWNWISFPRLYRDVTDPDYPDVSYSSISALTQRIFPEDYFNFNKNQMVNLPPNVPYNAGENLIYILWDRYLHMWVPQNDKPLSFVKSTRGYKIYLEPSTNEHNLFYKGTVLNPLQSIPVYSGNNKENWVGYFLPETQDPLEALTNIWPNLKSVKAEKWAAVNMGTEANPNWVISKTTPLRYGQMLILKTYHDGSFTWHRAGNPFGGGNTIEKAEHFSYNETDDYTTFFIEYDTLNPPLEIGAFVNDTCIGACKVDSADSLAFLQGYLKGNDNDSVVFVNYYGNKSSQKQIINSYYVRCQGEPLASKRSVKVGEKKDFYLISFNKPKKVACNNTNEYLFVSPNPASKTLNIKYVVNKKGYVSLKLHDIQGRVVATVFSKTVEKGKYNLRWNLTDTNGKINKGIYLLLLQQPSGTTVKKVIVR